MHEPNHLLHELYVAETALAAALTERDHAREWAIALESQIAWMTPSFRRNLEAFPHARGVGVYDGKGIV